LWKHKEDAAQPSALIRGNIVLGKLSIRRSIFPEDIMLSIRVGDTVAFRRSVAQKCDSGDVAAFRGVVTGIAGEWLFLEDPAGRARVMPIASMCRVAGNGVILELV